MQKIQDMNETKIIKDVIKKSELLDKLHIWIKDNTPKELIFINIDNYYIPSNILNQADHIYYDINPNNYPIDKKCFQGFGGQTLSFKMLDGTIKDIKGPWHSNSDALYNRTGLDLRNKTINIGFIYLTKHCSILEDYKDIIYYDEEPVISNYNRIKDLAYEYAQKYQQDVYFFMKGYCGGVESRIEYN